MRIEVSQQQHRLIKHHAGVPHCGASAQQGKNQLGEHRLEQEQQSGTDQQRQNEKCSHAPAPLTGVNSVDPLIGKAKRIPSEMTTSQNALMNASFLQTKHRAGMEYAAYLATDPAKAENWRKIDREVDLTPQQHQLIEGFT